VASDLKKAFDRLSEVLTWAPPQALEEVAQFAIHIITLRTRKGLDADGSPFKPYVKKYAQWRKRKKLRTAPPDLTVTGHMLGSIVSSVTENGISLEFSSPKELAKAIGNSHTRDFFDIRRDVELDAITDMIGDALLEEILK